MATETEKELDKIIKSFVEKNSHRDGYEIYVVPKPLKISILGHSGAGKTTLVESIIQYLSDEFDPNGILSAFVPPKTQQKYKRIHDIIDILCKTDSGFITNLNLGSGTSSVQTFDFYIDFKISDNQKIALPVQIQDTPGGFHNSENLDSEKYADCNPEYSKFIDHLKESQMVIIPIDTIKMQSVDMNDEEMLGAYNNTIQLNAIKDNLQQYFAKNPDRRYSLHFALTKCETYFSQDETSRESEKCFNNFKYWYSDIVNVFYKQHNVDIHYTPVETVGSFKLRETKCEITETEIGKCLRNISLFGATGQKIRIINGINDLTDDMFQMVEDIIDNGYIYEIRKVNERFINNDKDLINLFFTGRNAASDKIKNILNLIDLKRSALKDSIKNMVHKNRNDNYEYHTIIKEKL